MGVLRLNGKAYGGGIDVIEVTQAQYNALPESKLSDDILYVISDSVNGSDGYPPLIYSTEEREIGVWTDGKPLYEKTYTGLNQSITGNQWNTISGVSMPINEIIDVRAYRIADGHLTSIGLKEYSQINQSGVRLVPLSTETLDTLIIQYTKTTDTKGSGRWTTQGILAQHYSTTERLIGTWIDGKPLYEKTVQVTSIPNNNMTDTPHGISNIDVIVDIIGVLHTLTSVASNNTWTQIPRIQDNASNANIGIEVNNTNIRLKGRTQNYTEIFDKAYITIQYTKTTD